MLLRNSEEPLYQQAVEMALPDIDRTEFFDFLRSASRRPASRRGHCCDLILNTTAASRAHEQLSCRCGSTRRPAARSTWWQSKRRSSRRCCWRAPRPVRRADRGRRAPAGCWTRSSPAAARGRRPRRCSSGWGSAAAEPRRARSTSCAGWGSSSGCRRVGRYRIADPFLAESGGAARHPSATTRSARWSVRPVSAPQTAVILSAVRTPIGRYGGALAGVRRTTWPPSRCGRPSTGRVSRPATSRTCYLGCADQAGEDTRDIARMAVLLAGFPQSGALVTVTRLCASGLPASSRPVMP